MNSPVDFRLETDWGTPHGGQRPRPAVTCGEGEGELAQVCPALRDPVDCNLLGFSVHGILQARTLEWVAICFSRDLPDPGIEPGSPTLEADALPSAPPGKAAK